MAQGGEKAELLQLEFVPSRTDRFNCTNIDPGYGVARLDNRVIPGLHLHPAPSTPRCHQSVAGRVKRLPSLHENIDRSFNIGPHL
jgi:hypothetical protein